MPDFASIWIISLNKVFTVFVNAVIGQMHVDILSILIFWGLVKLGAEPG